MFGSLGDPRSRSEYGACSEGLPVARQIPARWHDMAVGLDAEYPEGALVTHILWQPSVDGGARYDYEISRTHLHGAEDRLKQSAPSLDVEALVADRISVERAGLGCSNVAEAYVIVGEYQLPVTNGVR